MIKKAIIRDLRRLKPAWAEYGIFTKWYASRYFEDRDRTIAVKSAQIHSRFEFPVSDKKPLCKRIGCFPVPVTADYGRFLNNRKEKIETMKIKIPGSEVTIKPLHDRFRFIRIQTTMIKTNHDHIQSTSKNETAKIQKAVAGVPSPPITLVAM